MIFDEHDRGGSAAKCFDAHGAGAGKDIEEAAAGEAFGENVEE